MEKEKTAQDEKFQSFVRKFTADLYSHGGNKTDDIKEFKPELADEYNLSSLGYVVDDLIAHLHKYLECNDLNKKEFGQELISYFAHDLSRAMYYTKSIKNNSIVTELNQIFDELFHSQETHGKENELDYAKVLDRVEQIKTELGIKLSDRFIFGEKLGIRREDMITALLKTRLERITGYVDEKKKFLWELFDSSMGRLISADNVEGVTLTRQAFSSEVSFEETITIIKKLVVMVDDLDKETVRYDAESLNEVKFILSKIEEIMNR